MEKVLSVYVTFRTNEVGLRVPLSSIAPLVPTGILKFVPAFLLSTSCRAWQSDRWPVLPGNSRDTAKSRPGARSIADSNGTPDDSTGSSSPAHLGCCPAPSPLLSAKRVSQQGQNCSQTIYLQSHHRAHDWWLDFSNKKVQCSEGGMKSDYGV